MSKARKLFLMAILSVVTAFVLCLGVVISIPTKSASAETLATENWTLAHEGDSAFRVQNGNTYWSAYTNNVTTASMLDYTEINGKTLSEINAEKPDSVEVTLQPAGGSIGSFYRVNINTAIAGFTTHDVATFVVRAGWSHTDSSGTYTIDTDLYFARPQGKASQSDIWKYIPRDKVVDISDMLAVQDQGALYANSCTILFKTTNQKTWSTSPETPNENGGAFLNTLFINGTSIKAWNNQAEKMLENGEITDITFGADQKNIKKGVPYAPIFGLNGYADSVGSYMQVTVPTGYINHISSFKIGKGFANLTSDGTLYFAEKDVEYVRSGSLFVKVSDSVDISDAFKILVKNDRTDGTTLYYLHTNNVKYWTQQYDSTNAYSINEKEWKGQENTSLQGGAVQMSYIEFNGTPLYDINASDNGSYDATQGNIASGGKYAPILAFLTPAELGDAIKLQIPNKYPSGSGTATDNHKTITIKKGFYVVDTETNIKYEVTKDIQWDFENGEWVEHTNKIETRVLEARLFGDANDAFAAIKLAGSDYENAPGTYPGEEKKALSFAQSANFLSHILIDGKALNKPGEAFLNVWSNKGYFTFRPGNNSATEITVLAGCQFPTYNALRTGAKEVYVTTEDITFVKGSDGTWSVKEGLQAGEYPTSVGAISYARDNTNNWMLITLTEKDYPKASEVYNVATTEAQMSALNLYDKIVVDGYTLRQRINTYGAPSSMPQINRWKADCFGIRIAGCAGALDGAKKVTIKAGAQFPSYAYITEGVEAYYVTTEEITFVNVGDSNGNWERQYRATFKADGEVVDVIEYVQSKGFTAPEVPEVDGYYGTWENYTANGNITINAIYTKKANVLGITEIKELRRIDNNSNILVINPANSDYPTSVEGSWNLGLDISHLQKFNLLDYVTINGKTLREIGVSSMAINKFTRAGLGLETNLSNSMEIVIKKGCEIPSYAFWKNPTDEASCYVVNGDYTCLYSAGGEAAFDITASNLDMVVPSDFEDSYILSDLHKVGYEKTNVFKDGVEVLTNSEVGTSDQKEAAYRYGYVDSTSFTLTFDFKYTGADLYNTFKVNFGTEGYEGNKYHFGWRFYLLRSNSDDSITQNICVEYFSNTSTYAGNITGSANKPFGTSQLVEGQTYRITIGYKLLNASTGEVLIYTAVDQYSRIDTYTLGGDFVKFAPYINSLTMNAAVTGSVTVSDPGKMDEMVDASGNVKATYNMQLFNGKDWVADTDANSVVLPELNPAEYNKAGYVFVGWTTNAATLSELYPAGYEWTLTEDTKLYAVWIEFVMRKGAGVRTVDGEDGIRFTADINEAEYNTGKNKGFITEIGTIVAPTSYLKKYALTHASLPEGYYVAMMTNGWWTKDMTEGMKTYSAAFINIGYDQFGRAFSARGYLKIAYTTGVGYVYTAYDENNHSRSIYDVATKAYDGYKDVAAIQNYVNTVADLTIDESFTASKNSDAKGQYTVSATKNGDTITVSVQKHGGYAIKAVVLNGVRVIMGYDAQIVIGTKTYSISGYKLNNNGVEMSFTLGEGQDFTKKYYRSLLQVYVDSDAYTAEHKVLVDAIAQAAINELNGENTVSEWQETYQQAVAELEVIKTAAELAANNTSGGSLATPALSNGLGYTVTWNEVVNADYYYVYDNNDNTEYTVYMAGDELAYKAEVVGNHSIYVVAHSYYERYNSATSNTVSTPEVKPVFSYKSMSDGLYKFSSSQMSTMGISTSGYYYDSSDKKYFAYYNKDTGWSPYPSMATDWTSPAEFPAHAQRLKDMGNNIIMVAYDSNAMYAEKETSFASSRLKYIMDTAWSMGMKVLVCDQVFYKLSMSDNSGTGATSKLQVTTAINNRAGFAEYVTHPAFYGFSLDDEPYGKYISAMSNTISALDEACEKLGVSDPFYLACLFQAQGGELGKELYLTQSSLEEYYEKWLKIDGVDGKYLYVDIYTQHAMDQPTNRYNTSFEVVYDDSYLGGKYDFHQAITAHTQNDGVLLEQDMYMSLLYAAAHNVAGYSWFCYFPISGELAGSLGGYDGNGYGNGIGNSVEKGKGFYNAAKTAGYQYELIQGWLNGYEWKTRSHNDSSNLLTTTLSNGSKTATMYVNADVDDMKGSVTVTARGSVCYLIGYGVGTAEQPYQIVSGSVTLAPGQAVLCME